MVIFVGDGNLFTYNCGDDQVIFAEDEDDISYMVRNLTERYKSWGLSISMAKTKYLIAAGMNSDLLIQRETIKCADFTSV